MATRAYGESVGRILALLGEAGPMTRSEICRNLGLTRQECSAIVSRLMRPCLRPAGPKRVRISGYVYDEEGQRRYPRAVYELGTAPDVPAPKASPKAVKARYLAARQLKVASVFDLALTRAQRRERGLPL